MWSLTSVFSFASAAPTVVVEKTTEFGLDATATEFGLDRGNSSASCSERNMNHEVKSKWRARSRDVSYIRPRQLSNYHLHFHGQTTRVVSLIKAFIKTPNLDTRLSILTPYMGFLELVIYLLRFPQSQTYSVWPTWKRKWNIRQYRQGWAQTKNKHGGTCNIQIPVYTIDGNKVCWRMA